MMDIVVSLAGLVASGVFGWWFRGVSDGVDARLRDELVAIEADRDEDFL